ncbi:DUF503 domain-containing protein [Actinoplanes xinjiangensis]|jgi:uncharacterized protein YlxP (DUF503 family)|uniref:DUF503 domain-containing protein n=1 Tax=Actinoplanes xinjiangensis TaxID=512350 RepID=A0A316FRG2_9ACTN|nr:DUF503 domain-containing protein [Actinoplanes xinjiangensis]PWK50270.1 hypothetical protein BC793_103152 [Actinoplanes xinjiangensis]GIF36158.1 hypothetical protein Axi01nite_04690 [Actinoplanes xinjiangensis]
MYTETAIFDLLLPGDSHSLKQKRSYVRPIIAMLKKFEVSVAEVGLHDLHGRAQIGVAVVAAEASQARAVVDTCENQVAGRPEIELLSVKRRLYGEDD